MKLTHSEAYKEILKTYFMAFVHRSFLQLRPNVPFVWNWHLEVMCAKLVDVMLGKCKRLIITVPPRSLKSHIASVSFPAFVLGHYPYKRLFCASYAQALGETFARDTFQLMSSDFYKTLFDSRIAREAAADFTTADRGGRFTTSVGGVTTGAGGDILIIDDPLKADEAMSDACRTSANEWMSTACYSRLNDKENGAIIIIMQRLHENDLVGHVLQLEPWEILSFPAIATGDEDYSIATPFGPRHFGRKRGEALQPKRESLATLDATRKRMGSAAFSAQYQQDPSPAEGLYVKLDWFRRYREETLPARFNRIVISWDTATAITQTADFSACTVWGTTGDSWGPNGETIYQLDVVRGRWEFPELEQKVLDVVAQYQDLGPTVTLIEDCASGQQLMQRLGRLELAVHGCKPWGDKKMRFCSQLATIERGMVNLPIQAPYIDCYLNELRAFPGGRHDDQVDSTSQALHWIAQTPAEPNFLAYARILRQPKSEPELSFRMPLGCEWRLPGGDVIYPGPDRIVTVSGDRVRWARLAGFEEVGPHA